MNDAIIRINLEADFKRAADLLKLLPVYGMPTTSAQYHPLTDAMTRLSRQLELLDAGKIEIDGLRIAIEFTWDVLSEYELKIFEYRDRNNQRWQAAKKTARAAVCRDMAITW